MSKSAQLLNKNYPALMKMFGKLAQRIEILENDVEDTLKIIDGLSEKPKKNSSLSPNALG